MLKSDALKIAVGSYQMYGPDTDLKPEIMETLNNILADIEKAETPKHCEPLYPRRGYSQPTKNPWGGYVARCYRLGGERGKKKRYPMGDLESDSKQELQDMLETIDRTAPFID